MLFSHLSRTFYLMVSTQFDAKSASSGIRQLWVQSQPCHVGELPKLQCALIYHMSHHVASLLNSTLPLQPRDSPGPSLLIAVSRFLSPQHISPHTLPNSSHHADPDGSTGPPHATPLDPHVHTGHHLSAGETVCGLKALSIPLSFK